MKILKFIGIGIGAIIALVLIIALFVSNDFTVSRDIEINKPVDEVYEFVADFTQRPSWDPWLAKEPEAEHGSFGTAGQPGYGWMWNGTDEKIGEGKMTVTEFVPNESITAHLIFLRPFEAESDVYWKFEATENGTKATWSNKGSMPYPMNLMTLTMDGQLGPDFESGLANLKKQIEG